MVYYKEVGVGSFGVVVKPPLEFAKIHNIDIQYTDKKANDVGKIFKFYVITDKTDKTKENYETELEELKNIKKIDKNHIFTVPFKGAYSGYISEKTWLSDSYSEIDSKLTKTREVSSDQNDPKNIIYQIILEDGGSELSHLFRNKNLINYEKFITIFNKFLTGMLLLQKKEIVHRDIKPPNVLYNGEKLNLIDFGLAVNAKDIYKLNNENIRRMNYVYIFNPPEYYIAGVIYDAIILEVTKDEKYMGKNLNKKYIDADIVKNIFKDVYKNIKTMKGADTQFIVDALNNFIKDSRIILNEKHVNDNYITRDVKNLSTNSKFLKDYEEFFHGQIEKYVKNIINILKASENREKPLKEILDIIFNDDLKEKFDVYSLAYIILPIYKEMAKLKGEDELNDKQKTFLSYLFNSCINTNPDDRISLFKLKKLIELEDKVSITSMSSKSSARSEPIPSIKQMSKTSPRILAKSAPARVTKGGRNIDIERNELVSAIIENPFKKVSQASLKKEDIAAYYASKLNFMDYIEIDYDKHKPLVL